MLWLFQWLLCQTEELRHICKDFLGTVLSTDEFNEQMTEKNSTLYYLGSVGKEKKITGSKKWYEEKKKVLKLWFKGFVSLMWFSFRADVLQEINVCLLSGCL